MRVLISGADGLLGYSLIEKLASRHDLHAIVRPGSTRPRHDIKYYEIDLSDKFEVSILPKKVDVIIHLAQSIHYRSLLAKSEDIFNVNVLSTQRLLEFGIKASLKKFIFASSGSVYKSTLKAVDENSLIKPLDAMDLYAASKITSEYLASSFSTVFSVDILRPFLMFGPRQRQSMLIPTLFERVRTGEVITLAGNDGLKLNPIFVDDVAQLIEARLTSNNNLIINVAGNHVVTLRQLCNKIGMLLNKRPVFENKGLLKYNHTADNKVMLKHINKNLKSLDKALESYIQKSSRV